MNTHHLRATPGSTVQYAVTPESAGWKYLSFAVVELQAGQSHRALEPEREVAIVPISGRGFVEVDGSRVELERRDVFTQMPSVLYAPPATPLHVTGSPDFVFAIGSAPAAGKYPVRLFEPSEMRSELRGGGTAYRQVNHILSAPLPAEHLILYEVYVPRGTWAGWAPHCHDGREGSPYLEEIYYFKLDRSDGFVIHRNWRDDEGFDELFVANDGDCVLVTKGYHSTVACPTSHMYFLNYLAGDLYDEQRSTPPCFLAPYTWIQDDWSVGAWQLPILRP
jgi:5-deoxy-glucuronate isomerase